MTYKVQVLELISGIQIVGQVTSEDEREIWVKNPIRIVFIPEKKAVTFVPVFVFTDDEEIHINKSAVIAVMNPVSEILNNYNAAHGNGLVVPTNSNKIIIP